jgi:hypothetical protein
MKTIFKNKFGNVVTQQQASLLDKYWKNYEENNVLKKKEFFIDQQLVTTVYYKSPSESVNEILTQFAGANLQIRTITFIGTKEYEQNDVYSAGELIERYNYLYDQNKDVICREEINLVTGLPIYEETKKYYFDRSLDPENELFDCRYNEDGVLEHIEYNMYEFQESKWFWEGGVPGESDIETLRGLTGLTQQEMNYYLSAALLP